jgi:hypothetical protein
VEVEAVEMGLPRAGGVTQDAPGTRPIWSTRARAESAPALDGRACDAGERERRVGEGLGDVAIVRAVQRLGCVPLGSSAARLFRAMAVRSPTMPPTPSWQSSQTGR